MLKSDSTSVNYFNWFGSLYVKDLFYIFKISISIKMELVLLLMVHSLIVSMPVK